jgi:cold shock CspA family protein
VAGLLRKTHEIGEKVFFHITAVSQKEIVCEGTPVTFQHCKTEKGLKATKVYREGSSNTGGKHNGKGGDGDGRGGS